VSRVADDLIRAGLAGMNERLALAADEPPVFDSAGRSWM
jgi:hypothetical protein